MRIPIERLAPLIIGSALLWSAPAIAQSLPEPAQQAVPLDTAQWQRTVSRQLPGTQRFRGLPEMRFGFLVDVFGRVRSCLALPFGENGSADGQHLCDAFVEHARFRPALDARGNAVESVFIAKFGNTMPSTAIDHAGVPIN